MGEKKENEMENEKGKERIKPCQSNKNTVERKKRKKKKKGPFQGPAKESTVYLIAFAEEEKGTTFLMK